MKMVKKIKSRSHGKCPFRPSDSSTTDTTPNHVSMQYINFENGTQGPSSLMDIEDNRGANSAMVMSTASSGKQSNSSQEFQDKTTSTCREKNNDNKYLNTKNERKRRACEMSNTTLNNSDPHANNQQSSSSSSSSPSQHETPLTFLCLSKMWVAATNRALSHPHEAQYGCTSSARSLLPLANNDTDTSTFTNSLNTNIMASSPLALVTRYGAPSFCVESVLKAEKRMVRRCIPNRGNPLHEAIMLYPNTATRAVASSASSRYSDHNKANVNEKNNNQLTEYVKIIRMLLKADEDLETMDRADNNDDKRATLMQDVDGNVPLHILIRQGFYHYLGEIASSEQDRDQANERQIEHPIFTIAKELIASSPEAVSIPDCTEFEVTPLILALRSSVYANEQHQQQQLRYPGRVHGIDYFNSTIERNIFDICKIMLQYSPASASLVMVGYTAVHSAVFHGRCCDTIRLLLNADEVNRHRIYSSAKKITLPAAMQANKFGELPLHFAAMRGECTRSISLLSKAAPWAALRRDMKVGLTPIHWLWVRFMDCMLHRFGKRSFFGEDDEDVDQDDCINEQDNAQIFSLAKRSSLTSASSSNAPSLYSDNGHICFDLEYHIRTEAIDPPVDYTKMRYIVPEHSALEDTLTTRVIRVLRRVRERHRQLIQKMLRLNENEQADDVINNSWKMTSSLSNHQSRHECPFANSLSQPPTIASSENEVTNNDTKCPYAHLAVISKSNNKCPYSKTTNKVITNSSIPEDSKMKMIPEVGDSNKKCPFRCPFVFDSYPLSEELLGADIEALREEQVISLFWAKVTSLLHAAALAKILDIKRLSSSLNLLEEVDHGKIHMLHTACSSPCPYSVVRLCLELHPEQLNEKDSSGKLPLHHAALRLMDSREFIVQNDEQSEVRAVDNEENVESDRTYEALNFGNTQSLVIMPTDVAVIESETAKVVDLILSSSPEAARAFDSNIRLPLNYCIDSIVKSIVQTNANINTVSFQNLIQPLKALIDVYPDALEYVDGMTNLLPFMQASAVAVESVICDKNKRHSDKIILSLVYCMILEKPSMLDSLAKKSLQ